jgi:hypothetical protein
MPLVNFSKKNLVTLGETGINIDVEPWRHQLSFLCTEHDAAQATFCKN